MEQIDPEEEGMRQVDFLAPKDEVVNELGKLAAAIFVIVFALLGGKVITTNGQLAALAITTLGAFPIIALVVAYKRRQRYTLRKLKADVEARKSQANYKESKYDYFYEHITTTEQKLLQAAIVWSVALALLGYIKLIPKGTQILAELIYNS